MSMLIRLAREELAATAAEFALVLPLLLIFLFGIIDVGRFMWEYNEAEKATQMGARFAVVTNPVLGGSSASDGLLNYSFATNDSIVAGTAVPTAYFTSSACTTATTYAAASCTCVSTAGGFCGGTKTDTTAFKAIRDRMLEIDPAIADKDIEVDYKNVGLGFAGDPDGPDVSPLVTVKLTGLTFQPLTTLLFGASFNMPTISASLTGEDLSGTTGN
ncbi:MAG TPA: TadE/TadG family type IV pilus assembly protein [Sphingomicrobium sp.]|nr:TadE/TadG family type IV pilus assembly protein [Sphingomicrobium sp.]